MVTVQVSQTFTLITSLLGTKAYPAADIAALYGDRWTIELVFYELKVTVLGAGTQCRSPHPGGIYPEILYAVAGQHALRLLGRHRRHRRPGRPRRPAQLRRAARRNHHLHHSRARIDRAAARRTGRPAHRHHPASQPLDRAAPARPPLPPLHHQEATVPQTRRHRCRPDPPPPAAPHRRRPRRRPRAARTRRGDIPDRLASHSPHPQTTGPAAARPSGRTRAQTRENTPPPAPRTPPSPRSPGTSLNVTATG